MWSLIQSTIVLQSPLNSRVGLCAASGVKHKRKHFPWFLYQPGPVGFGFLLHRLVQRYESTANYVFLTSFFFCAINFIQSFPPARLANSVFHLCCATQLCASTFARQRIPRHSPGSKRSKSQQSRFYSQCSLSEAASPSSSNFSVTTARSFFGDLSTSHPA